MRPAFVDFKYILNTSLENITYIPTLYSAVGLLHRYVNRQITVIIVLIMMNVFNTLMPFSQHLWQLYTCAVILGITAGAWLTAYNVWLIEIWQEKAVRVLLFSQLMHGLGQFAGEQLDRPYLTGEHTITTSALPLNSTETSLQTLLNNTIFNATNGAMDLDERRAKLVVPFM
ncbi:unnamed protein product, partial [Oppiella nova]